MKLKLSLGITLTMIAIAATFTACAAPESTQKTQEQKPIVIGIMEDLSGAQAAADTGYVEGEKDCVKYINETNGGIEGHQLKLTIIDFKLDGALAMAGWERLKGEGVPIVMGTSCASAPVIHTRSQEDRIPLVAGAATMDQMFPQEPSFYFTTVPHYPGTYESVCRAIEQDWSQKGNTGTPKVGFDVIAFGTYQKMLSKCSQLAAEKRGWEYIITNTSIAPADVTTQVLQMKNFGADYAFLMTTVTPTIVWLKELDRQNIKSVIFGTFAMGAPEVYQAVGDLCIGKLFYQTSPEWGQVEIPMIKLCHELNADWHPEETWRPVHYIRGFHDILVVAEALERAGKNVGYENMTGDAMKDAMETINNFEPMGYGIGFTWTPTDHQGIPGIRWSKWIAGGNTEPVGGWDIFDPLPDEQKTLSWWITE